MNLEQLKYGRCKCCLKVMPIVWTDWSHITGPIKVCWDCAIYLDWQEGLEFYCKNLHLFVTCKECNKKFIPKKEGQTKCTACWIRYFTKRDRAAARAAGALLKIERQVTLA